MTEPTSKPAIQQVAILASDGVIHTMPRPARHGEIINRLWRLYDDPKFGEHGFLLEDGTFADRAVAWIVANNAGQLLPGVRERDIKHLFTEDLW